MLIWRCKKTEAFVNDMRDRGVHWEMYRDGRKPFPVFKKAEFLKALNLPVPERVEMYIEITPAYWIYRGWQTTPEQAKREKKAQFEADVKAFSDTMDRLLNSE